MSNADTGLKKRISPMPISRWRGGRRSASLLLAAAVLMTMSLAVHAQVPKPAVLPKVQTTLPAADLPAKASTEAIASNYLVKVKAFTASGGDKPGDNANLVLAIETSGAGTKDIPWSISDGANVIANGIERGVLAGKTIEVSATYRLPPGASLVKLQAAIDPKNTLGEPDSERANNVSKVIEKSIRSGLPRPPAVPPVQSNQSNQSNLPTPGGSSGKAEAGLASPPPATPVTIAIPNPSDGVDRPRGTPGGTAAGVVRATGPVSARSTGSALANADLSRVRLETIAISTETGVTKNADVVVGSGNLVGSTINSRNIRMISGTGLGLPGTVVQSTQADLSLTVAGPCGANCVKVYVTANEVAPCGYRNFTLMRGDGSSVSGRFFLIPNILGRGNYINGRTLALPVPLDLSLSVLPLPESPDQTYTLHFKGDSDGGSIQLTSSDPANMTVSPATISLTNVQGPTEFSYTLSNHWDRSRCTNKPVMFMAKRIGGIASGDSVYLWFNVGPKLPGD